jgi:VIT1/CCC1 family predicted Fe2+/Mn2+ transporter
MPEFCSVEREQVLDPAERLSEVLFGLIMALSFTGSLSAATAGHEEVRTMLFGAIGCNVAWGIVDAVMYVMGNLMERGRGIATLNAVRRAADAEHAHRAIGAALPPLVTGVLQEVDLELMRQRLLTLPEPPPRSQVTAKDMRGAVSVFILVFLSTFPLVVPFILMHEPVRALRVSNGIAIAMLFLVGWSLGRCTGHRPLWMGLSMVAIGAVLVSITIALGG